MAPATCTLRDVVVCTSYRCVIGDTTPLKIRVGYVQRKIPLPCTSKWKRRVDGVSFPECWTNSKNKLSCFFKNMLRVRVDFVFMLTRAITDVCCCCNRILLLLQYFVVGKLNKLVTVFDPICVDILCSTINTKCDVYFALRFHPTMQEYCEPLCDFVFSHCEPFCYLIFARFQVLVCWSRRGLGTRVSNIRFTGCNWFYFKHNKNIIS